MSLLTFICPPLALLLAGRVFDALLALICWAMALAGFCLFWPAGLVLWFVSVGYAFRTLESERKPSKDWLPRP